MIGPGRYVEVEVCAEHGGGFLAHLGIPEGQPVPDWARYYRHVFSSDRQLPDDVARALGVPADADPETAALALARSPGFQESMMPGTVRVRRRTITVSGWKAVSLAAGEAMPLTTGPACPSCSAPVVLAVAGNLAGPFTAPAGHEVERVAGGGFVFRRCPNQDGAHVD